MRTNGVILSATTLAVTLAVLTARRADAQAVGSALSSEEGGGVTGAPKVSVFFGAKKAFGAEELRTNALEVLKARGYVVPETNHCVINVQVQGKDPGCAVMFWDLKARMTWQVRFDAHGEVSRVFGGAVGHGAPAPGEPRPKMPEGGVRVKP